MNDTEFRTMQAQARFENCTADEPRALYAWLCAEIEHAHSVGIAWIVQPSRPVENLRDYNTYKLIARQLAQLRSVPATSGMRVA